MSYKKGDTLQIKQGSCIVLETSINAYVFFEEMENTDLGVEHPIYSISADVDDLLGANIWDSRIALKNKLESRILHRVLYGDIKIAILDTEVHMFPSSN